MWPQPRDTWSRRKQEAPSSRDPFAHLHPHSWLQPTAPSPRLCTSLASASTSTLPKLTGRVSHTNLLVSCQPTAFGGSLWPQNNTSPQKGTCGYT